jgi:lipopolysaccharide transport system permease protein
MLGIPWSFIISLTILAGCTFVVTFLFSVRWPLDSGSNVEFFLAIFVTFMTLSLFAEGLHRAPRLVINNVAFSLKLLPWIVMGSTRFHLLIGLAFLCTLSLAIEQSIHSTALYLPLIFLPLVTIGVIWFVASIGIYLRDTGLIHG